MQTQKFPKISLAAARVNAGLNQQEAAKALGVSVATLQNYESGKTVPQWGTVQKIERVYKFPADFIFLSALSERRANSAALPWQQQLRLPTTSASALMTLWSIPSSYNHSTTTPVP